MKYSIIGAGTFGTAMAVIASRCGNDVLLWAHDLKVAEGIERDRVNPEYLNSIHLDDRIRATHSLEEAGQFGDLIFMVVPSHYYRQVLSRMEPFVGTGVSVISGTKGIENETLDLMS
ncbi:MAG TPA: NAD(P)-binding domain-containing protein, partial [Thermoanaerobaculia bacterium]